MYSLTVLLFVSLVVPFCATARTFTKRNGYAYKILPSDTNGEVGIVLSETGASVDNYNQNVNSKNIGDEAVAVGYSAGSGLRSIAQGSANQAYSAVASQHAAGGQAAFLAKNTLAQAATQAAATAQTALEGKHVLLQELQQQRAEAEKLLSHQVEQLKATRIATKLAQQTAQAANNHVAVLTAALNDAKSVAENAGQTANEMTYQLAAQSTIVGQAQSRLDQLEVRLKQATVDFEATKDAAIKAAASAAEAQVNASKAAAQATLSLHESTQH